MSGYIFFQFTHILHTAWTKWMLSVLCVDTVWQWYGQRHHALSHCSTRLGSLFRALSIRKVKMWRKKRTNKSSKTLRSDSRDYKQLERWMYRCYFSSFIFFFLPYTMLLVASECLNIAISYYYECVHISYFFSHSTKNRTVRCYFS